MWSVGIEPPDEIHFDGKIHRFNHGKKRDKSAWYCLFADGVPAGRFGDWREGIEQPFKADIGRTLTPAEEMANARRMAEARAQRDAEIAKTRAVAADTCAIIWDGCSESPADHPYLIRKGVQPHGARMTGDGRLVLPAYDEHGELASLQYIDQHGDKQYHGGGARKGTFWWVGDLNSPGIIYIAEGFATSASISEATGRPCVITYNSGNIPTIAQTIRAAFPSADLVIVADHDTYTPEERERKAKKGPEYAAEAAALINARVIVPPIEGMDANDYAQAGHDLTALLLPPNDDEIINKLQAQFGDQLGDEYDPPDELVEGLITIGGTSVVYGDSNSGKTFFCLSVAAAIAEGAQCYGRQTDPGLCIYLATEAPASIRTRLQAIKRHHGYSLRNIVIVPVPLNFYTGDGDAQDVIALVRAVEKRMQKPARLIIGDTLARMSSGANENSGEDMGPIMARFDRLAVETRAHVMIIHHNGKDAAKGARGWSGIRAHIDTELEVKEESGIRSVSITKQRELPGKGDTIFFKLHVIEMGITKFGNIASTCVAVPDMDAVQGSNKTDSAVTENIRIFERAWFHSGTEDRDGLPYISRSAFAHWFVTCDGRNESTASKYTKPNPSTGPVSEMLNSGLIEEREFGWVIVDNLTASILMMRR